MLHTLYIVNSEKRKRVIYRNNSLVITGKYIILRIYTKTIILASTQSSNSYRFKSGVHTRIFKTE